jgi:hypothetical protein
MMQYDTILLHGRSSALAVAMIPSSDSDGAHVKEGNARNTDTKKFACFLEALL